MKLNDEKRSQRRAGTAAGKPVAGKPAARKPAGKPATTGVSAARAAARARLVNRTKTQPRPVSPPPARKPVAAAAVSRPAPRTGEVSPEVRLEIDSVNRSYATLERDGRLSDIYDAIGQIESDMTKLPLELDALRRRGYVHSGQLEDRLAALDEKWDEMMPRVEAELGEQVRRLDRELDNVERKVNLIGSGNAPALSAAKTAVSAMESKVSAAKSALQGMYGSLETELYSIESKLNQADWMMDQLDESPHIQLRESEGPIAAVNAFWQQDGKEGPKGVLYLTDQRLLFEQKEEVVTKKRFGIFKSESEVVHKLHLDIGCHDIESVKHSEEGGFMGMGKDDILELVCSANASVSRARFHLKGQESSDWAGYIKRVQTGEINNDREEEYLEEIQAAQAVAGTFPAQCPNCFAAVPTPPRGVVSVNCEFCGSAIRPS